MFKKYVPREDWGFEKTYAYALKVLSRQTCNYASLREKLKMRTSAETLNQVIDEIRKEDLLDDLKTCKETALMWIQKKPISKIQLQKKLCDYGFSQEDVHISLVQVQSWFSAGEVHYLGGKARDELDEIYKTDNLWVAMLLVYCMQICVLHPDLLDAREKIKGRMKLKGFQLPRETNMILDAVSDALMP